MLDIELILKAIVERFTQGARYHRMHACEVLSQSADMLLLDVRPTDPSMPTMQGVPLRIGTPGIRAKIAVGQTVLLGFENGDPKFPYCACFSGMTQCQELFIDATVKVSFESPSVNLASSATPVARLGDSVSLVVVVSGVPIPCTGTITGSSQSIVKA